MLHSGITEYEELPFKGSVELLPNIDPNAVSAYRPVSPRCTCSYNWQREPRSSEPFKVLKGLVLLKGRLFKMAAEGAEFTLATRSVQSSSVAA